MKRFLLFQGSNYYPSGGIDDLVGDFDSLEEALSTDGSPNDLSAWFHVWDSETQEKVATGWWNTIRRKWMLVQEV